MTQGQFFWAEYYHHHHYHVVPLARISQNLSRHFSPSFIASGRSSGLHPVSPHSCCMNVRDGRPAFDRPYGGVHRGTSLMSSSLLLQQCPACLVRLTWIVFVMGGRWPYSCCLVGCCCQDLFNPSPRSPYQRWRIKSVLLFTHIWRENNWIYTFLKGISAMWNAISLVQDLNSCRRIHFLRR